MGTEHSIGILIGYEECGACPECGGLLCYEPDGPCTCHINPPGSACITSILTCDSCGFEVDEYHEM